MAFCCCSGALLSCPMGFVPAVMNILPKTVLGGFRPLASITDCIPYLNVSMFGPCKSLLNPVTAAQTAAAFGVLTPGPCMPVPVGVWLPMKPNVITLTGPVLMNNSMLICAFGGIIKVNIPGQFKVMA